MNILTNVKLTKSQKMKMRIILKKSGSNFKNMITFLKMVLGMNSSLCKYADNELYGGLVLKKCLGTFHFPLHGILSHVIYLERILKWRLNSL